MKKRIVVVENNVLLARLLEFMLERDGYQVKVFEKGQSALEWMARNMCDLLITDLYMPMMSAMEIIQALNEKTDVVPPVIVLLATYDGNLADRLSKAGADEFISLPFGAGELRQRVKRLLKSGSEQNRRIVMEGNRRTRKRMEYMGLLQPASYLSEE